jgi:hypothetical protein
VEDRGLEVLCALPGGHDCTRVGRLPCRFGARSARNGPGNTKRPAVADLSEA